MKRSSRSTRVVRKNFKIHHEVLRDIKSSNVFDSLFNYRKYLLKRKAQIRACKEDSKIKDHIKMLDLTLRNKKFYGKDPETVLRILSEIVHVRDTLTVTEGP